MRVVAQRVARAKVTVEQEVVGAIGRGLVLLAGVADSDRSTDVEAAVEKVANLRVFADEAGRMSSSLLDIGGEVLVVSQFTLYGDVRRGRRPSFTAAADPDRAEPLIEELVAGLAGLGLRVATGEFGARMQVELVNDGPVTLVLEFSDGRIAPWPHPGGVSGSG